MFKIGDHVEIVDDNEDGIRKGYIGKTGVILRTRKTDGKPKHVVLFDERLIDSHFDSSEEINTRWYYDREIMHSKETKVKKLLDKLR